jgi:ABC-type nitrate/sulfonate/bicarbonate transport system substrate-binding protein
VVSASGNRLAPVDCSALARSVFSSCRGQAVVCSRVSVTQAGNVQSRLEIEAIPEYRIWQDGLFEANGIDAVRSKFESNEP